MARGRVGLLKKKEITIIKKKSHSLFQCYQAGRLQVARGRVGLRGGTQFTCFPSALLDLRGQKIKNTNSEAAAPEDVSVSKEVPH